MNSGVPNMVAMFGYLRTSWTMRVDLVSELVCRLLNHMDHRKAVVCTPTLRPNEMDMRLRPWIEADEFNPGYMKRSLHLMPRQGDHVPWEFNGDYYQERELFPAINLDDDALIFEGRKAASESA